MRAALFAVILFGCTHPAPTDEGRVRAALHLPSEAVLQGIDAQPQHGGTFGREGLRIHAVFELPPGASEQWSQGAEWRPLPLPEAVWGFRDPPVELRAIRGAARVLCYVVVLNNTAAQRMDCANAPERFDQYRVAIYRPDRRELSVVFKNNY